MCFCKCVCCLLEKGYMTLLSPLVLILTFLFVYFTSNKSTQSLLAMDLRERGKQEDIIEDLSHW